MFIDEMASNLKLKLFYFWFKRFSASLSHVVNIQLIGTLRIRLPTSFLCSLFISHFFLFTIFVLTTEILLISSTVKNHLISTKYLVILIFFFRFLVFLSIHTYTHLPPRRINRRNVVNETTGP